MIQPFTISGWAIHGPGSGTGIDAVHIYGCGSTCVFWGAATYGVSRPDVAAVYGSQYQNSGYSMPKAGLTPGTYYLQVHAHSTINGAWYQWGHWFTVQAGPEHTLEVPTQGAALASPLTVSGGSRGSSPSPATRVMTCRQARRVRSIARLDQCAETRRTRLEPEAAMKYAVVVERGPSIYGATFDATPDNPHTWRTLCQYPPDRPHPDVDCPHLIPGMTGALSRTHPDRVVDGPSAAGDLDRSSSRVTP